MHAAIYATSHHVAHRRAGDQTRRERSHRRVEVVIYRGPEPIVELRYAELWEEMAKGKRRLMPWTTPTLRQDTRTLMRDYVLSQLGATAMIPNSVLRIMSDAMAGLTHSDVPLSRLAGKAVHCPTPPRANGSTGTAQIWLVNADGSKGRKAATYAHGQIQFEGDDETIVPIGTLMEGPQGVMYQTVTEGAIGEDTFGTADAVALRQA